MEEAIKVAQSVADKVPDAYQDTFVKSIDELSALRKNAISFAYHLR